MLVQFISFPLMSTIYFFASFTYLYPFIALFYSRHNKLFAIIHTKKLFFNIYVTFFFTYKANFFFNFPSTLIVPTAESTV